MVWNTSPAADHAGEAGGDEGGADATRRRDQGDHRDAHAFDQAQVVAREALVEQRHGRGEGQAARLPEALELRRSQLRQGEGLGELQLAFVGLKRELIQLGDVLQQPDRAGEAPAVRCRASAAPGRAVSPGASQ